MNEPNNYRVFIMQRVESYENFLFKKNEGKHFFHMKYIKLICFTSELGIPTSKNHFSTKLFPKITLSKHVPHHKTLNKLLRIPEISHETATGIFKNALIFPMIP